VTVADVGSRPVRARAGATAPLVSPLVIEKLAPEVGGAGSASTAATKKKTAAKTTSSSAGYAKTTTAKKSADPLAFLKDPSLGVEQKLMRLLAHLNAQYEAEMQEKMNVLAGKADAAKSKSSGSSTSATSKPKKKGLLSSIVDGVNQFFPAVGIAASLLKTKSVQTLLGKIGGPVLAAAASAMGFPALAPALLKLGPAIVNVAVDAAKAFDAGANTSAGGPSASASKASASSTAKSSSSSATAKKELSDGDRQLHMMELQRLQEKQKEMFQLVSNILKANHDTRFAIIGNVR
jgi:hypothetical protein